jgi:hypothetical protein|tara:strand:- start:1830 stop:2405 length:576 start_codon:yes stop_codon:yes gene_type:complete
MRSKKFEDLNDSHFENWRENQFDNYQDELDSGIPTEWIVKKSIQEVSEPKNLEQFIDNITNQVTEGNQDALNVKANFHHLRKLLEKAEKQINEQVLAECEQYAPNNSEFDYNGFKIQKRNGGKYYDFSNVKEYTEKEQELKDIKEKLKHAVTGIEKGSTTVIDGGMVLSDGEVVEIPTIKQRKDSVIIKKV